MRKYEPSAKISQVETTTNILTGRGGLVLFVKYLNGVGIYSLKIIRRGGQIILKVTQAVMAAWHVDELWARCQNPPPIVV